MFSFQGASLSFFLKRLNETTQLLELLQSISQFCILHSAFCILHLKEVVGQNGLEPSTSRLSVVCSSQLSYWPISRRRKLHITRFGHKMSKAHSLRCVSSPNQIPHTSDLIWCLYTSLVEISGIEPLTSCLQGRRSPS